MHKPLVLVADDNLAIRTLIAEVLELEGYPVVTAANGLEALEVVDRARPALVVLDMRMPVVDGWSFARELRARGVRLPILVITAAQSARSWAAEIGAEGYLAKPFGILELLGAVERLSSSAASAGGHRVPEPGTPIRLDERARLGSQRSQAAGSGSHA